MDNVVTMLCELGRELGSLEVSFGCLAAQNSKHTYMKTYIHE